MYFSIKYLYFIEKKTTQTSFMNVRLAAVTLVICVGMVSVTSASRYVTSASGYQGNSPMYIRNLIPRNWPRKFRLVQCMAMHIDLGQFKS